MRKYLPCHNYGSCLFTIAQKCFKINADAHVSVANIPGNLYLKNVHILIFERKKMCIPRIEARTAFIVSGYKLIINFTNNLTEI